MSAPRPAEAGRPRGVKPPSHICLRANASTAGPRCTEPIARFDGLGMEAAAQTPAPFDAFIAQEFAKWSKVIKQAGIEAQ